MFPQGTPTQINPSQLPARSSQRRTRRATQRAVLQQPDLPAGLGRPAEETTRRHRWIAASALPGFALADSQLWPVRGPTTRPAVPSAANSLCASPATARLGSSDPVSDYAEPAIPPAFTADTAIAHAKRVSESLPRPTTARWLRVSDVAYTGPASVTA
jgi:hypothetical protein